jgi:hypothetical protein
LIRKFGIFDVVNRFPWLAAGQPGMRGTNAWVGSGRNVGLPGIRGYLESTAKRPLADTLGSQPDKHMRLIYSIEARTNEEHAVVAAIMIDGDHQMPPIAAMAQNIVDNFVPAGSRERFEFQASRLYVQLSKGHIEKILRRFPTIIRPFG